MKALIIIPAYNEAENIYNVIKEIQVAIQKLDYAADYLVVNDCSQDATLSILRTEGCSYISHPVNLGIGGSMQSGYLYALENCYDIAVQMDGDGQHNPEYLDAVIQPVLRHEADMVIGSRYIDKLGFQSSAVRRMGIFFLSRLIYFVTGVDIKDVTSGFRAVNKNVIEIFAHDYAQDYPEPESIVCCAKKHCRIKEVPVAMRERWGGKSSISAMRSVYYMIKVSIAILFTGWLKE